jgi:TonB family protein
MVRPVALFRPVLLAALALTSALGAGCASREAARRQDALREAREERHSHVQQANDSDDQSSQMTVQGEEGTLNESDVESALQAHVAEIRDCHNVGRRVPPRAGARVLLRLFVDPKGEVDDVAVLESSLGDKAMERCIADILLGVVFERPTGHKATTFDYPVEFRPARQVNAERRRP